MGTTAQPPPQPDLPKTDWISLPSWLATPSWVTVPSWVTAFLMVVGVLTLAGLIVAILPWSRVWANRVRARLLPAGIVGFAYSLPLAVVLLVGLLISLGGAFMVGKDSSIGILATLLLGAGASLVATAIAAGFITARELTLARIRDSGLTYIWSNRKGRVSREEQALDWMQELRKARTRWVLLGTSLSGWVKDPEFADAVRVMAGRVKFQILMLAPDSPAADMRQREELEFDERTKHRISESFLKLLDLKDSLPERIRGNFQIYFYEAMPTFSLCWVDGYMIVTHYLPGLPNKHCPAFGLWDLFPFKPAKEAQLYHVFADNLDFIRRRAIEVTADNVDEKKRVAQGFLDEDRRRIEAEAHGQSGAKK